MIITIIIFVVSLQIVFNFNDSLDYNTSTVLENIEFSAEYIEDKNIVRIIFQDTTNKTGFAILEILGMDVTFHQEYHFIEQSHFVEDVYIQDVPKYGWKTTPVILEIQHAEFGKIGLKTEVYQKGETIPKIIVEKK